MKKIDKSNTNTVAVPVMKQRMKRVKGIVKKNSDKLKKKVSTSSLSKGVKNVSGAMKKSSDKIKKTISTSSLTKGVKTVSGAMKGISNNISRISKSSKQKKTVPNAGNRGVVYIRHIPHGFYEEEMKQYFSQFGKVTAINMPRSKLGKSKGYAFIEFLHPEVAKVAAETMNNYLMVNRLLKTTYIPPEEQKPERFKLKTTRKEKYDQAVKSNFEGSTKVLTPTEEKRYITNTIKKIQSMRNNLIKKGIHYDFQVDGSEAILTGLKTVDPDHQDSANDETVEKVNENKTKEKSVKKKTKNPKTNPVVAKLKTKLKETTNKKTKSVKLVASPKPGPSTRKEAKTNGVKKSLKTIKKKKDTLKNTAVKKISSALIKLDPEVKKQLESAKIAGAAKKGKGLTKKTIKTKSKMETDV